MKMTKEDDTDNLLVDMLEIILGQHNLTTTADHRFGNVSGDGSARVVCLLDELEHFVGIELANLAIIAILVSGVFASIRARQWSNVHPFLLLACIDLGELVGRDVDGGGEMAMVSSVRGGG